MSRKIVNRITSALLSILALSVSLPLVADAEEYLNQGIKLFSQKKYSESRPYFDKAAENAPWDSNAFYYQALAAQYCRDFVASKRLWAKIIEKFPGTPAATNATQAMRALDPAYFTRAKASGGASAAISSAGGATSGSSSGGSSPDDEIETKLAAVQYQAPSQARIPVSRAEGRAVVAGSVNGRSISFDFSGSTTSLALKDARNAQITKPDRTPIKAGERVAVNVRIGDINAASFPIMVDDSDKSKLGDDFFRKFTYQLDPSMLIVTKKSGGGGSGKTAYDVPFRKSGKDLLVDLTINGRRVSMLFDPQGGGETVVPSKRVREFGLDVETNTETAKYDAEKGTGPQRGEAGWGEEKVKSTAEAKVCIGPVQNQIVTVRVDEKAQQAKIGSDAFGGWKYTVDQSASLIRFSR